MNIILIFLTIISVLIYGYRWFYVNNLDKSTIKYRKESLKNYKYAGVAIILGVLTILLSFINGS